MSEPPAEDASAHVAACWELGVGERFCASLANGRERCRRGTCILVEPGPSRPSHPPEIHER